MMPGLSANNGYSAEGTRGYGERDTKTTTLTPQREGGRVG